MTTDTTTLPPPTLEADAERLLLALDTIALADGMGAGEALRHAARLRFSLERVDDLRRHAHAASGAFTPDPARVEIACAILDAHGMRAETFLQSLAARRGDGAAREPGGLSAGGAGQRVEVDEALMPAA
jgi:hypothetical protein